MNDQKKILDACCGGRMFWFNKAHPNALYIDIREEQDYQTGKGIDNRHRAIKPDKVMDFRTARDTCFNAGRAIIRT